MVKFKITRSIADVSTFKMWERREVASFSDVFVQGIINSFPSTKSLYSKKGAEQDPTRTKCLQWMTPSLSTHCHLPQQDTGPTHPCTAHTWVPLESMHEESEMHIPGQDLAPGKVTSAVERKFSLSLNSRWDGQCQTQAMLQGAWEDAGQGCDSASVLGSSPWHHLQMRNVWDTEGQLCLSGRAERERRTEQSTIPWNLDWEGCVSLEINFQQNAPPNDWQLHPRTYTCYKNTQVIPQTFIK